MSAEQGGEGAARIGWETLWRSLTGEERQQAALVYVRAAERFAPGREAVLAVLARDSRSREKAVARWSVERRAERLARVPSMDPPLLAAILARFLVDSRGPMVRRFLDLAGVAHRDGEIDAAKAAHGACDPERLRTAVRPVGAEFPPRDVALFLDALEGQRVACLEGLAAARRPPEGPTTQGAAS
jgi:hypothetical protein